MRCLESANRSVGARSQGLHSVTEAPSLMLTADAANVAVSQNASWHSPGLFEVEQKSPFATIFPAVSRLHTPTPASPVSDVKVFPVKVTFFVTGAIVMSGLPGCWNVWFTKQ